MGKRESASGPDSAIPEGQHERAASRGSPAARASDGPGTGDGRGSGGASERFRNTREAHQDETAEDYVEAIAEVIESKGEARVKDLAEIMGVSHVTVSRIITRLEKKELVRTAPYRPIELTAAGARMAARARARHEVVLRFLLTLGVPRKQAEIDAEGIEHHVSDATIRAIRRAMEKHKARGI